VRSRGQKSPPTERREASASSPDARNASPGVGVSVRLTALRLPSCGGEGRKDGVPGAGQTIRAAERWLRGLFENMALLSSGRGVAHEPSRRRAPCPLDAPGRLNDARSKPFHIVQTKDA